MKKELYCVHDKKSETYDGFVLYSNIVEATRSFQMACENNEVFKKWPEDFQLVKVLEFCYNEKGFLNDVQVVAEAKDFVRQRKRKDEEEIEDA